MLCGLAAVMQASGFECVAFDPFSLQQNGLAPPEVDVSRREIGNALVVSEVVVVSDEVADLLFEIARKVIVLKQDAVLERLMPAFDLALGLRMQGRPANMAHALVMEPFRQIAGHVARAIVTQEPGAM